MRIQWFLSKENGNVLLYLIFIMIKKMKFDV